MNLTARQVPTTTSCTATLADLPLGSSAIIGGLSGDHDPATCRRLFDLGFTPGTVVSTVRRTPFGGPSLYRVGDYEIALRPAQARTIFVTGPADEKPDHTDNDESLATVAA